MALSRSLSSGAHSRSPLAPGHDAAARTLWRAVGRDEAGYANGSVRALGSRGPQARGFEMRPGLLRTIAADRADIEAVALGKRARHARFNRRRKSGKDGQRGSNKRGNSDG